MQGKKESKERSSSMSSEQHVCSLIHMLAYAQTPSGTPSAQKSYDWWGKHGLEF